MENRNEVLFEKMPIPRAFRILCLPVILGMVVNLLYNMVDTYFIGRLGDAAQMAAVSLCSPVFIILMGLGNIFGIGGSSVVSRLMGEKKHEDVRRASAMCFWIGILCGFLVGGVILLCMKPFTSLLGASENTAGYTAEYLWVIVSASPLILLAFTLMNILRCDGAAKESMVGSVLGAVVNMALDPLLILALHMGVRGAAIATVAGYAAQDVLYCVYVLKKSAALSLSPKLARPDSALLLGVFAIGLPASVTNVLSSISTICMNNLLLSYGDSAIAAMGIAVKVTNIVTLIGVGFAAGLPPIIGYNYGAGDLTRLREVLKRAFLYAFVICAALSVPVFLLARPILRMFMDGADIVEPGAQMLRAMLLCGPFLGLQFVVTNYFQATGKALPAMLLSLCRQGIVFLICLYGMRALLGWNGIVYAQTAADYLTLLICAGLFTRFALPELRSPS